MVIFNCSTSIHLFRSEMRSRGRHLRETEERFCFLVASDQETSQIYQHGLKVEKTNQHSLGKPSHGVYLFRHVDVALKNPDCQPAAGKNMIIFKVCGGKDTSVCVRSVAFFVCYKCNQFFLCYWKGALWKS